LTTPALDNNTGFK